MLRDQDSSIVAIAIAFAVSGAGSGLLFASDSLVWWVGIPFAVLFAFLSAPYRSIGVGDRAIGYAAIWPIAYTSALFLDRIGYVVAICMGGVIGAIGLVAVTASAVSSLFNLRTLFITGLLGGVAALPLALDSRLETFGTLVPPMVGIAIWQAVVGSYILVIFRRHASVPATSLS